MIRYDVRSPRADDFINHQEILDTLAYAAMPRRASGLRNSGVKISSERSSGTTPLWRVPSWKRPGQT